MYVFSDTVSELKDKKSSKLQEAFLSTLRCPDTSYALWGLWARTCLQQHHHFILRLWIVCSVTCRLQRRLRCLCFREAALLCIKCTVLHPQLCFHATLLLLPRHPKEDQMFPSVSANAAVGRLRSPERPVLSDIYVRLSSLGPELDPYVVLAASHLHHLSRCSAPFLCVTVSAWLVSGEGGRLLWIRPVHRVRLSTAQLNKRLYTHRNLTHTYVTRRYARIHTCSRACSVSLSVVANRMAICRSHLYPILHCLITFCYHTLIPHILCWL